MDGDKQGPLLGGRRYGSPTASGVMACHAVKQRAVVLLFIVAFVWLLGLSIAAAGLRNDVSNGVSPTAPFVSASIPVSAQACSSGATNIVSGMAASFSEIDGGLIGGAGTTAYIGARQIAFQGQTPSQILSALTPQNALLVVYTVGSILYGNATSYVTLIPAVPDWVIGDTIQVSATGAGATAYALPFPADDFAYVQTSAIGSAIITVVGQGKAVAVAINLDTAVVDIGPSQAFADSFNTGAHLAVLSTTTLIITHYCPAAGDTYALCATAAYLFVDMGPPEITLGPKSVFAPNHQTHAVTGVSGSAFLITFPMDNATSASTADEELGFPLGAVLGSVQSDLLITLWGSDGAAGSQVPPQPWVQPWVRAHYFFSATLAGQVTQTPSAYVVVIAAPDRSIGDAIRVMSAIVSTGGTYSVSWGDWAAATDAGVDSGYRALSLAAKPLSASASTVLLYFHDDNDNGAPSVVKLGVNLRDGALRASLQQFDILAGTAAPTTLSLSAALMSPSRSLLLSLGSTGLAGVTVVEHLPVAAGISVSGGSCAGGAVAVALSGVVSSLTYPQNQAASPIFSSSRGTLHSSLSDTYISVSGTSIPMQLSPDTSLVALSIGSSSAMVLPWQSAAQASRSMLRASRRG